MTPTIKNVAASKQVREPSRELNADELPRLVVELAQSAGYEYAVGCVFRVGASSEEAAVRR